MRIRNFTKENIKSKIRCQDNIHLHTQSHMIFLHRKRSKNEMDKMMSKHPKNHSNVHNAIW